MMYKFVDRRFLYRVPVNNLFKIQSNRTLIVIELQL
jgi:hypothetical protein